WQAQVLHRMGGGRDGELAVRARPLLQHAGALEVFVVLSDRDGLFAAIVASLDRLGLPIQQARLLVGPEGHVFDTFEVPPSQPQRPVDAATAERALLAALAADDRDAVRPEGGARTLLSLVSTDRPGLLADVTRVLRQQRLRVHDARIATFGERAEDVFQITDERDQPLADEPRRQALRDALLACLEGEQRQ